MKIIKGKQYRVIDETEHNFRNGQVVTAIEDFDSTLEGHWLFKDNGFHQLLCVASCSFSPVQVEEIL